MQPGLHPRSGPRPTTSDAEKRVFLALLGKLPAGWTGWHGFRLLSFDGRFYTTETECDFVFVVPRRGILLLEVKGGLVRSDDGRWTSNGKPMELSPKEQAHRARRVLRDRLWKETSLGNVPAAIAVCFPDVDFDHAPPHADLTGIVVGRADLPRLGERLLEVAERLLPPNDSAFANVAARLHSWWGDNWVPRMGLVKQIKRREAELVELDTAQLDLLHALGESTCLAVEGGAGTGKTLLATQLYDRWRREGRDPLYLCYTRGLALALRAEGLSNAFAVRELARRLVDEAQLPLAPGGDPNQWNDEQWKLVVTQAAVEAIPALALEPRPVLVDEAQDFAADDWDLVRALVGEERLWTFADPGQAFWERTSPPQDLRPRALFRLAHAYRCPPAVQAFAMRYRRDVASAPDDLPDTGELHLEHVSDDAAGRAYLAREIDKLVAGGTPESDILVLSLAGVGRSDVARCARLGDVPAVRVDDPTAGDRLVADTFLRCKGLERPVVFVVELGRGRSRYDFRMHIAITRATARCVIVVTEEERELDARLRGARAAKR